MYCVKTLFTLSLENYQCNLSILPTLYHSSWIPGNPNLQPGEVGRKDIRGLGRFENTGVVLSSGVQIGVATSAGATKIPRDQMYVGKA